MAIKIDLEKSYYRLERDFTHRTLIRHNLDKNTCNLIYEMYILCVLCWSMANTLILFSFREELGRVTPFPHTSLSYAWIMTTLINEAIWTEIGLSLQLPKIGSMCHISSLHMIFFYLGKPIQPQLMQ